MDQRIHGASQRPGDTFTVRFGETFVNFRVTEVIPEKRIAWQVADCNLHFVPNKQEWNNTSVVWDVSAENESTSVRMTHEGLVRRTSVLSKLRTGLELFCEREPAQTAHRKQRLAGWEKAIDLRCEAPGPAYLKLE